jgi:Mn2+/Fe2+ NRAMP family transporter
MCTIQLISAHIGRVTGLGLAGNMRRHYPTSLLYPLVGLLVIANTSISALISAQWPRRCIC